MLKKRATKKKYNRSFWALLVLLLIFIFGWITLWKEKPSIDPETQKVFNELVEESERYQKEGLYQEAIDSYTAALNLLWDTSLITRIDSLKVIHKAADSSAWVIALQKNTSISFLEYLRLFPNGNYASNAKKAITILETIATNQKKIKDSIENASRNQKTAIILTQKQKTNASEMNKVLAEIAANMVTISSDTFMMGCPYYYRPPTWDDYKSGKEVRFGECGQNENPAHKVKLSSFLISKYEVTQDQWYALMGYNPSKYHGCAKCPVEMVSWEEIQHFIKKLNELTNENYRLPTEAEWEYAARGGNSQREKRRIYAGGENLSLVGWFYDNSDQKPHPVGQKKPNDFGLYDMSGNILEYCQDWYKRYYYANSPIQDPKGPSYGTVHVTRGGSFLSGGLFCRITERGSIPEKYDRAAFLGFRLAKAKS